jgi:alpha-mannosidase
MDQGEQQFTLRLQAAPDLNRAAAARLAGQLLRPPVTTPHVARHGTRPWRGQFLDIAATGADITGLKVSEDLEALVVRALDVQGSGGSIAVGTDRVAVPARGIASARLDETGLRVSDGMER